MPSEAGYYRHPTIHGDTIVFVCEEDLWSVPAAGGVARRLTANPGTISFPSFSPDGSKIAFTGRDDGPPEVYVMDSLGGAPRRLTWLGQMCQVAGWNRAGTAVLFSSDWRQPFMNYSHLYAIPADGGSPNALRFGPAKSITLEPEGKGVVIGRNSGDPARWKRYRGGTAGTLWIDRTGEGSFTQLVKLRGNLASPMWIGSRIYFLSDHEGCGNLYSCTPTGRDLRRHTDHEDFYVRYPNTDGRRIAYHAGADLYTFDPATGVAAKVSVAFHSTRSQRNRKFVSGARAFESFALHPKGQAITSVHRGAVFAMNNWEGAATKLAGADGARFRLAQWMPDGKRVVAITDAPGEEAIAILSVERPGERKIIQGDFGRALEIAIAPTGPERLALTNQRQELILVDLKTGKRIQVEKSPFRRIEGLAWSPDGRWLAYSFPCARRASRIHILDATTGKVTPATRPDFFDEAPAFDPEGKYLYFISTRIFDPVHDALFFDLGFPKGSQPFLLPLRRDTVSPFPSATRPARAPGTNGLHPAAKEKPEPPRGPYKVEIDFDGIEDRVVAFPVPEGRYLGVLGARGRVFFSSMPIEGTLDATLYEAGEPAARARLEAWDLEAAKLETVHEKINGFTVSHDTKVLAIRSGNKVRVLPSTYKVEQKQNGDMPGRESGWLDMDRVRVGIVPGDEWTQMFREAWRLQRDQFWTPDMAGIDWPGVHDRYLPLVRRVATRAEFSDLMWEMQGELGTSHCYEMGGDYRPEPTWYQGFLGADIEFDPRTASWRIVRIPRGDSWRERANSPLAAPGLNLAPGDEILEVAGQPVDRDVSPYERLTNLAGQDVRLTVRSGRAVPAKRGKATPDRRRSIVVRTLSSEYMLRYRNWVETNRRKVHESTNGRVGYIHIPNMGPFGFSEFHRYFSSEVDHEGLVIDVRWNGGGNVSQLLLQKLLRKRVGYDANRYGPPESYPSDAPMGAMVALTNEYAGSDGDIFSHCFKLYGLGPLIGKRTWGGVVGIWPRHSLVDGAITTQPEFAFWFNDVGWGVENYGTDPDIEVEIRPQDHAAGQDPQLDRGIGEILKILKKNPPRLPDFKDKPRRTPPRLPRG
jgi:tricorn protease